MKTFILNSLTEDKIFKINASSAQVFFSQQKKKKPKTRHKYTLLASWKINETSVLKIISTIAGKWQKEDPHKYVFIPQSPSTKKWIVYVYF